MCAHFGSRILISLAIRSCGLDTWWHPPGGARGWVIPESCSQLGAPSIRAVSYVPMQASLEQNKRGVAAHSQRNSHKAAIWRGCTAPLKILNLTRRICFKLKIFLFQKNAMCTPGCASHFFKKKFGPRCAFGLGHEIHNFKMEKLIWCTSHFFQKKVSPF